MLTLTSPVETPLHRLPAAVKLATLCLFTLILFRLSSPLPLVVLAGVLALLHLALHRSFAVTALRQLRPLWPFLVVIALWHGLTGDVAGGAIIALRLIIALAAANLVTMTTRLSDMLAVFDRLTAPFARIGLPARHLSLAIALTLRFIPVLAERIEAIRAAWSARSPRRPGWRILIPATIAALDEADHVAEALRARGGAG